MWITRAALTALLFSPAPVLACGMLAPSEFANTEAAFAGQTLLVDRRADRVDLHVRMTIAPGAESLSWVLPVAPGASLRLGDEAIFAALQARTAPSITIDRAQPKGGCSAGDSAGAAPPDRVDVKEVGSLGDYEYAIIGSGDAEAVVTWLTENGYALPEGAAAALQPYADRGLDFIGVRLERDAAAEDERPDPLVLSLEDEGDSLPMYPLGLSATSVSGALPVVIYVIGPGRAKVDGARHSSVAEIADLLLAREYYDYLEAVDGLQAEIGEPLFVTEAALVDWSDAEAPLAALHREGAVLTRLFAHLPVDRIADLQLGWHPEAQSVVEPEQHRKEKEEDGCRQGGGPSPAWLAVFLGLAAMRLRRSRR